MSVVRKLYVRFLRPHLRTELRQQRFKLVWFVWGYGGLFPMRGLSLRDRFTLLQRFLKVDWNVAHAHRPSEITTIVQVLAARKAKPGEGMVEAGCYRGGSSAKFSIACALFGYKLWVYDSFQGVEPLTREDKAESYDFSGEYAVDQEIVEANVARFGEIGVCTFTKGWFRDTLARSNGFGPVRLAYVDCDLARGTKEALTGVMPCLVEDGVVFSQDYHLPPVRALLSDPSVWKELGVPKPRIQRHSGNLASLSFSSSQPGCVTTARADRAEESRP